MKNFNTLVLALGAQLAMVATAQAGIRSVKLSSTPGDTPSGKIQRFIVEIDSCRSGFPTVASAVTKIGDNAALLELVPFPGHCAKPDGVASLTVVVEDDLVDLGLDPDSAKIFVQLQ
jgi:hypothetical protein